MINVYKNSDTEDIFNVTQFGAPYNLDTNNITRVVAYVCDGLANLVSDSDKIIDSDNSDISWTADVLTLKLGRLNVPPGRYKAKVKFYNVSLPLGFVVQELLLEVNC